MRTSSCLHLGMSSSKARGSNTFPDSTWAPAAQPENCPNQMTLSTSLLPKKWGEACYARRRTDFGALLQDADREVGVSGAAELLQPDRRGEPRGPGAHDDHVVAQRLPPAAEPPSGAPARREGAAGRSGRCPRRRRQRSPCRSRGFLDGPLHCSLLLGSPRCFGIFGEVGVWPSGEEVREDTEVWGRGVALCWVLFSILFVFGLDLMRSLRWTDRRRRRQIALSDGLRCSQARARSTKAE